MRKGYYLKDTVTKGDLEAMSYNSEHVWICDEFNEFCVYYKNYPFDSDNDLYVDFEDYGQDDENTRRLLYNNRSDIDTVKYEDIKFLVKAGLVEGFVDIVNTDIYKEVKHGQD